MAETMTVCLPAGGLYHLQWLTSLDVDHAAWVCRLCVETGHATTEALARSGAIHHLVVHHGATVTGD